MKNVMFNLLFFNILNVEEFFTSFFRLDFLQILFHFYVSQSNK
jgi:hypothetical protein